MKDIQLTEISYSSNGTSSRYELRYGDKHITNVALYHYDVADAKTLLFALQAEMLKDVVEILQKKTP